ncbi:MAG: Anaerobic ribonucleoside-triphosphate reductase-activating protein [Candidatus Ordinivivax streblomastigis]|uniref:Anaerobic ribonucleoside-triphosphate reductase-activating protein n=1 Tax=Candidatus Ordinivivax streblomastigis TaxID=2540710 RepID=A0A5M8NZ22_9BACT|nr:MAG: Anaerobic ribonucleoside-triphosphate reductase-activating protein [Candidatus Ordinivivax streblomastigis]
MNNLLSLLDIVEDTTVDGPGFRTSIYAAGCPRRCQDCHNPQSWAMENGALWTIDAVMEKIKQAEFSNVTFSGGDPLMQVEAFTGLAKQIRKETNKTIWCYTGYLYEQITASAKLSLILPYIDVLVDGRYDKNQRDESLPFIGSKNQRVIDVSASRRSREGSRLAKCEAGASLLATM